MENLNPQCVFNLHCGIIMLKSLSRDPLQGSQHPVIYFTAYSIPSLNMNNTISTISLDSWTFSVILRLPHFGSFFFSLLCEDSSCFLWYRFVVKKFISLVIARKWNKTSSCQPILNKDEDIDFLPCRH